MDNVNRFFARKGIGFAKKAREIRWTFILQMKGNVAAETIEMLPFRRSTRVLPR